MRNTSIAHPIAAPSCRFLAAHLSQWHDGRAKAGGQSVDGSRAVPGVGLRLALLMGFTLLVIFRLPHAWAHGRFLDEEGSIFLAFAWHRPAMVALLHSFGGYLNIGATATTVLTAKLVRSGVLPLEFAPYLTMTVALSFQLLPATLILTGRAIWLSNRGAVVAALLIIAICPRTEEVFVNVLHIQFHLALCVGLILALDVPSGRVARIGYGALLLFTPLCGPAAIVLLPFFALRGLIDRDVGRLAQATALAAGTALQMVVFFTPSPVRGQMLDPVILAAMSFVRLAALPYCSASVANKIGRWIFASYRSGTAECWYAAAGFLIYCGALIGMALSNRKDAAIWLIVPGLAIGGVSFGGGMIASDPRDWFSVGAGERYDFLPLVLVGIGLVVIAARSQGRSRIACAGLCFLTVISGAISYPKPVREVANGPDWSAEVAAWRRDHTRHLLLWPKQWTADLSDQDRPCSTPRSGRSLSSDPSYCESVWLQRVAQPAPIPDKVKL